MIKRWIYGESDVYFLKSSPFILYFLVNLKQIRFTRFIRFQALLSRKLLKGSKNMLLIWNLISSQGSVQGYILYFIHIILLYSYYYSFLYQIIIIFIFRVEKLLTNLCPKECIDIIKQMLVYDPEERISAYQALRHEFFKDLFDKD